ncbi:MAG TPA: hypothetical protein VK287_02645 [Gaiellaceae bacterium]|nr:hypothetical protein [Gaiellaceae bacterium]
MSVALELPVEFQRGLPIVLEEAVEPSDDIEPWELHSELALVSPEVCRRARELLPDRDPYAFLDQPRELILLPAAPVDEEEPELGLRQAVAGYAAQRLFDTARFALYAIGFLAGLASLAELLH